MKMFFKMGQITDSDSLSSETHKRK